MLILPSKELLSEVFMYKVTQIHKIDAENNIHFNGGNESIYPYFLIKPITINIYELAHKCKEWAHSLDFMIQSYLYNEKARADLLKSCDVDEKFIASTEPEAIFKACDYILNELSNK